MGLFNFLSGDKDNYGKLVRYYEEYTKSCTLQPTIFPQSAYSFDHKMDVVNRQVRKKDSYIAQFNRLIDAVRLGDVKDQYGIEKQLSLVQEMYLRMITATWIISKLNSYDNLGKRIRNEINLGYEQLIFSVNYKIITKDSWKIDCCVQLFKTDSDVSEINVNGTVTIKEDTFNSEDPFKTYVIFENTPNDLLKAFHDLTRWLFFNTKSLTNVNQNNMTIGRVYADFWLKKMVVTIIISSEEWDYYIHNLQNIIRISNIEYKLVEGEDFRKNIEFKFNLKTKNNSDVNFEYTYSIPSAETFGLRYIRSLANFVSTNHNLSY